MTDVDAPRTGVDAVIDRLNLAGLTADELFEPGDIDEVKRRGRELRPDPNSEDP